MIQLFFGGAGVPLSKPEDVIPFLGKVFRMGALAGAPHEGDESAKNGLTAQVG